jgi:hypothetical protein
MAWLNVDDLRMPQRRAILLVMRADLLADRKIFDALQARDPLVVESLLRLLVLATRPELACCMIDFVGYDQRSCCFEIGVSHPSLEPVPAGQQSPREALDFATWLPGRNSLEGSS